jgi:hypothetical protein
MPAAGIFIPMIQDPAVLRSRRGFALHLAGGCHVGLPAIFPQVLRSTRRINERNAADVGAQVYTWSLVGCVPVWAPHSPREDSVEDLVRRLPQARVAAAAHRSRVDILKDLVGRLLEAGLDEAVPPHLVLVAQVGRFVPAELISHLRQEQGMWEGPRAPAGEKKRRAGGVEQFVRACKREREGVGVLVCAPEGGCARVE